MEWFALLIPVLSCIIGLKYFRQMFAWWEYLIPPAASVLIILLCKFSVKTALVSDKEYWGSMVVEARYYEAWETWVTATCSYTTTCCCDSKGENCQTETHYYDCSYCDHNSAQWKAYDDAGNSWSISQSYYNYLQKKWSSSPQFVELSRSIDYSGGCGKDGDMYSIKWDNKIESSESAVTTHSYTNRVQASHSSFKLEDISRKEAKKLGLYDYPERYDYYKQPVILGLDSIYSGAEKGRIETFYQYFNGYYGSRNKVKLFVCLFYDKPDAISYKQEAYWDGGNQNELVVCIGMDKVKNLQWVRVFSWTKNKRIGVDIREDIMNTGTFQPYKVYDVIQKAIGVTDMHRSFKEDFSYLTVDLPQWALILVWLFTLSATAGSWYWCYKNEFKQTTQDYE